MHVLVAIDGSEESTAALHFLAHLPFTAKPKVTLVTVLVDIISQEVGLPFGEPDKAAAEENMRKAKAFLDASGFTCDQVIESGHASRTILDKAKELGIDLIVLGARGHSAAYRVILGSTANFIANHARCSVLVVRPNKNPNSNADELNVLLAYDMSAQARIALAQMLDFDWPKNAELTLATFFEKPRLIDEDSVYDAESLSEANKTLAEVRGQASVNCQIGQVVREAKHIGDGLRDLAAEKEVDLLFLGDTGKSTIAKFFLGSISSHLLHHSKASVWLARKNEWH